MAITKTIGTNKNSEIIIYGKYVSEHHALLIKNDKPTYIEDLQSTFGIHINGGRISKRTMLQPNDRVKIGTQLFHWKDYIGKQGNLEENLIFLIDLIRPTGIVNWNHYKFILLLSLGVLILIPITIPVSLLFIEPVLNHKHSKVSELIVLIQYTNLLLWSTSILTSYTFLNLTQKAVRGKMKRL